MDSTYLLVFLALATLYTLIISTKNQSKRLKSMQKSLDDMNPEINYDFNKFNTASERETRIEIRDNEIYIISDIQNIQIANQTLVSKISSEFEGMPIQFDIVVQPFDKFLFEVDGYRNFNNDGILIVWSYGNPTKIPIEAIELLDFLKGAIPNKPKGVYLNLESFNVDKQESKVILNGIFEDGTNFKLNINYASYLIEFIAPINSFKNFENYNLYA